MEKEQLKVSTKTQGLNFQDISCIQSAWHRLMMLEGLAEAGEGYEGAGEDGAETAVSLLALDQSLETNGRSAVSQQH